MLSCKDVTDKASDYLDRNLSLNERVRFKLHLFMCAHCRNFVSQINVTISTLQSINHQKPVSEEEIRRTLDHIQQHLPSEENKNDTKVD